MTVFEIEYIDRLSGEVVTKTVPEMRLAMDLARELAMATGRRAIIRKKEADRWSVIYVDLIDRRIIKLDGSVSKREAMLTWKRWNPRSQSAALLLWPEWAELPRELVQAG